MATMARYMAQINAVLLFIIIILGRRLGEGGVEARMSMVLGAGL